MGSATLKDILGSNYEKEYLKLRDSMAKKGYNVRPMPGRVRLLPKENGMLFGIFDLHGDAETYKKIMHIQYEYLKKGEMVRFWLGGDGIHPIGDQKTDGSNEVLISERERARIVPCFSTYSLGNHEYDQLKGIAARKKINGKEVNQTEAFKKQYKEKDYKEIMKFISTMPLAGVTPWGHVISHSGPGNDFTKISQLDDPKYEKLNDAVLSLIRGESETKKGKRTNYYRLEGLINFLDVMGGKYSIQGHSGKAKIEIEGQGTYAGIPGQIFAPGLGLIAGSEGMLKGVKNMWAITLDDPSGTIYTVNLEEYNYEGLSKFTSLLNSFEPKEIKKGKKEVKTIQPEKKEEDIGAVVKATIAGEIGKIKEELKEEILKGIPQPAVQPTTDAPQGKISREEKINVYKENYNLADNDVTLKDLRKNLTDSEFNKLLAQCEEIMD